MHKISVCLATYNGEKYIRQQLDSILGQLRTTDEVIVSDDSSTDRTTQIVEGYHDQRIVILRDQKFRSPIFNFENALKHASGDLIFLADQDDIWVPQRVKTMLPFLENYDLVVSDCKIVNDALEIVHDSYLNRVNARTGFIRNLTRTSPYIGCCMAFNRKVLEKALPFPRNIPMHDFWIAMLCELLFTIKFVREPLVLYRRHSANASFTGMGSTNPLTKRISFRINTLVPLVKRVTRNSK